MCCTEPIVVVAVLASKSGPYMAIETGMAITATAAGTILTGMAGFNHIRTIQVTAMPQL
jgi:hypothetical protein